MLCPIGVEHSGIIQCFLSAVLKQWLVLVTLTLWYNNSKIWATLILLSVFADEIKPEGFV